MNIVGQLAETVFVTVKELYRGLNPATLTGGIDVIVVRQADGSFQCSPFHVRFGKLGVLRSKEKIVDIEINGESIDLHMKLGDNGEAFFVEENMESLVPAHLCTSPIPFEGPEHIYEIHEGSAVAGSSGRRKKRRRKRIRSDTHPIEDNSSSDEREREKEWERENDQAGADSPLLEDHVPSLQVCKSVYYSISEEPSVEVGVTRSRDTHPYSDGEHSPIESNVFNSRPTSPKSDSELLLKCEEPQIQWNWGGFPTLCQSERTLELQHMSPPGKTHFRTIERQDSFDMGADSAISCGRMGSVAVVRPQPRTHSVDQITHGLQTTHLSNVAQPGPESSSSFCALSLKTDTVVMKSTSGKEDNTRSSVYSTCLINGTGYTSSREGTVDRVTAVSSFSAVTVTKPENQQKVDRSPTRNTPSPVCPAHHQGTTSAQSDLRWSSAALISEGDSGIYPYVDAGEEDNGSAFMDRASVSTATTAKVEGRNTVDERSAADGSADSAETSTKREQQGRKKGKRNFHLGPTDIYLDDLHSLNPEVAALYFPKSETEGASQQGSGSRSQSPHSLGSVALDSGTEYLSDSTSTSYSMDVSMSLCGMEGDTSQITKEKFMENIVTYGEFASNPGIIEDPSLVVCINSNYYNWAAAAPMILSMTAFQKNLPKSSIERLMKDKMPKKSGRWWFSWRRRDMQKHSKDEQDEQMASVSSAVKATLDDTLSTAQCISQMYRKSLRLTSKQIEQLKLRDGANKVVFSVTTQYQGTCRCEAAIYLWNWDDRVIISDIDGTITKSDALGHILPQFGKDWTHKGIAKLYHKIHQNGYKFLYCSARAIGMAAITKDYLQWVNDGGTVLPKGPVLLAPSSLFSALHREVIEKKPEVFKIACLSDIRDLFSPQKQPFYAAFGNRTNDAYAYRQVGVPENRIFTVNPKGELIQEKTKVNKSSYSHLSEIVEHFFPDCSAPCSTSYSFDYPEFSSFSYWREPLPQLDLDSLL
ncbi:phosphatidate phosphatase LPIN3 isoform X2 [Cynoglossus semilaevis]|uniref:phosphatidate phosphatase LPIN3 isoform X2 n=1 Tax=Cynoglossus semilaevis TaxID=244447 RepID=UPI000D62733E|nr:phosphatidate phosphatase LPIN3-like isoform X2 [Cynoglossus semilaevis]